MYPTEIPVVSVYSGDPVTLVIYALKNPDGTPRDLSEYTGWASHWRTTPDAVDHLELTVELADIALGKFTVSATPEVTAAMPGNGYWDVQAFLAGEPRTFATGRTALREDVTHV